MAFDNENQVLAPFCAICLLQLEIVNLSVANFLLSIDIIVFVATDYSINEIHFTHFAALYTLKNCHLIVAHFECEKTNSLFVNAILFVCDYTFYVLFSISIRA